MSTHIQGPKYIYFRVFISTDKLASVSTHYVDWPVTLSLPQILMCTVTSNYSSFLSNIVEYKESNGITDVKYKYRTR